MAGRCLFFLILALSACPLFASEYFTIQFVDAATGRGVPLVELWPQNGSPLVTDSNGIAAFDQSALMGQNVWFSGQSYGYASWAQTLHPTAGGSVTIPIQRLQRAERLYRITGTGIYRDSVEVGATTPISHPLLNANVRGQDSVQTAIYKGQIYWFWGDTLYEQGGLGNFRVAGARSQLPGQGGLDPAQGVNLDYFVDPSNGWSKEMMPVAEPGLMWIDGVFTVHDDEGNEHLFGRNARYLDLFTNVEQGLAHFNESTQTFQRFQNYSLNAPITPQGHSFRHNVNGDDYIYFSLTYPNVRVKADWSHVTQISTWEAYTPLRANTRYDSNNPPLDLDEFGNPIFGWKTNTDPLSFEMLEDLVQRGHLTRDQLPFRLEDHATGQDVRLHRSSVHWNEFRQSWVMIGVEFFGNSLLGEVWFSEAPTPEGPWVDAIKVATHDRGTSGDYSFYNPTSHPFFDQAGGRYLYFEGTYTNTFSGNPDTTPLYEYNQMMYRLDLATIPDLFPRLTGDYNGDGIVDAADFVVWQKTFGSIVILAADGSRSGTIDVTDYELWKKNYGRASATLPLLHVPEPSVWMLIAIGGCLAHVLRRREREVFGPAPEAFR